MLKNKGFTLIEIIVVIAIIGIVSMIVIPNMIGWRGERKLEGAARNFMSDMQLARLKAIRESEDVAVLVNPAADSYSVFVDVDKDDAIDAGEEILRNNITMPSGIDITGTTLAGDVTRFNSRGRPNVIGRVTFQNTAGNTRQVFVNLVGRLRVQY